MNSPGSVEVDAARCPRCGSAFHCGVEDTTPCACSTLALAPSLLGALREQYRGCLCRRCLESLAEASRAPSDPA